MKNNSLTTLVIFLVLLSQGLFSQNQNKKWYFGTNAGLDFMTSPPTVLTNGLLVSYEPTGSISDAAGSLLFYTDGITVWNKLHVVMANGTGLLGNVSAGQSGMIMKQPGSPNLYYIFTLDGTAGPDGLRYSVVDMSLASGNGSVTVKNTLLYTPSTEKLTAVRHCNGEDIWIISHDWNSSNFRSYLLTNSGISSPPVLSAVGSVHTGQNYVAAGCMKASPNGKKLGLATYLLNTFELFDFDNTTGVVSNSLALGTSVNHAYGCEFSPDGTKFYGASTDNGPSTLYQWDVCAGSNAAILASMYSALTQTVLAQLQRATDGRIYVGKATLGGPASQSNMLGVINNPNAAGAACNFVNLGQSVAPKTTQSGLPNMPLIRTDPQPFPYSGVCSPLSFSLPTIAGSASACAMAGFTLAGVSWNFGDPASGPANTSVLNNPVHSFSGPGTYTVQLTLNYSCGGGTDLISQAIPVSMCTGLSNIAGPGPTLNVYPNPGRNYVAVETGTDINLTICDALGKPVMEKNLRAGNHTIDLSEYANGVYIWKAVDKNGIKTLKVFKSE